MDATVLKPLREAVGNRLLRLAGCRPGRYSADSCTTNYAEDADRLWEFHTATKNRIFTPMVHGFFNRSWATPHMRPNLMDYKSASTGESRGLLLANSNMLLVGTLTIRRKHNTKCHRGTICRILSKARILIRASGATASSPLYFPVRLFYAMRQYPPGTLNPITPSVIGTNFGFVAPLTPRHAFINLSLDSFDTLVLTCVFTMTEMTNLNC